MQIPLLQLQDGFACEHRHLLKLTNYNHHLSLHCRYCVVPKCFNSRNQTRLDSYTEGCLKHSEGCRSFWKAQTCLAVICDMMQWWRGQSAHLWLTAAVFSMDRHILRMSRSIFVIKKDPDHIRPALPPLFHCSDKVWPRKHGEEAVTICRRRFITGASRVALVCWPAAVDGLPEIKSQQCLRFIWLGQKKTFFLSLFSQKVHESKNKNEKQLYFYHAGQLKSHCCTAGRCYWWNINDCHCGHSKCHMYRCYLLRWEVIHHIIILSYNEMHWAPLSSANHHLIHRTRLRLYSCLYTTSLSH